eukprot:524065_1
MSSAFRAMEKLEDCEVMCKNLRANIQSLQPQTNKKILSELSHDIDVVEYEPRSRGGLCTGHFGKIYALHWGSDSNSIVTASQDGKLIIWGTNPSTLGNKQLSITLKSAWVMTCALSSSYLLLASGGLDNIISIWMIFKKKQQFKLLDLYKECEKHKGFISCVKFLNDEEFISASGDSTCMLWDIEYQCVKTLFTDHKADVMSIDINKENKNVFVSGSVDATAKIWDLRSSTRCIANFSGHVSDINSVKWFVDNQSFVSGSDDGTVRLFDMRSYGQLNEYSDAENRSLYSQDAAGVTGVDVSKSGQYIFSAYDNGQVYMWSSLKGNLMTDMPHESRVSCLSVSPHGYAFATGCWDFNLRLFY